MKANNICPSRLGRPELGKQEEIERRLHCKRLRCRRDRLSQPPLLDLPFWRKLVQFRFGTQVLRMLPLKESAPRIAPPFSEHVCYHDQIDALTELSAGKKWDFVDVRPDAIVGFVITIQ